MEIEEMNYINDLTEKEKKQCRTFMNARIDIFQANDEYVYRNDSVTQKFKDSYEHLLMQNDASSIMASSSNLLLFTIGKGYANLNGTLHGLKKIYSQSKPEGIENDPEYIKKQHSVLSIQIMRKKLANDEEYIRLNEIISSPTFDLRMKHNMLLIKFIFSHPYLIYHPKYEEIIARYKKYLDATKFVQGEDGEEEEDAG